MANYSSPTIVQQQIPCCDITTLEFLILTQIFDYERDGDTIRFYQAVEPQSSLELDLAQLHEALRAPENNGTTALSQIVAQFGGEIAAGAGMHFDASDDCWTGIFQDIVKRSETIDHISITSAFVCDKMRADGFGGAVILITKDTIRYASTTDLLRDFLCDARTAQEIGPL